MASKTTVRRVQEQDEEAVFAFRRRLFPQGHRVLDRDLWRWKFFSHPWADSPTFFVLEAEGNVVGTMGYWPMHLRIGGEEATAAQLFDFFVDEAFKGLPAVKLYRMVSSCAGVNLGANLSSDARNFFASARWLDLSPSLAHFSLWLKRPPEARGTLNSAKFAVRRAAAQFCLKRCSVVATRGRAVAFGLPSPSDVAELLDRVREDATDGILKDLPYFRWRYQECPGTRFRFAGIYKGHTLEALAVYVVSDPGTPGASCSVVDILWLPGREDAAGLLISKLVERCGRQGCTKITTDQAARTTGNLFVRAGFRKYQGSIGLMARTSSQDLSTKLAKSDGFHFTLGDTDFF